MVPADNVRRENKEPKKTCPGLERACQRQEQTKRKLEADSRGWTDPGNRRTRRGPDPLTGNNKPEREYQGHGAKRRREQGKHKVGDILSRLKEAGQLQK